MLFLMKLLLPLVLVPVISLENQTNLTCFRSSEPAAVGAKQLFSLSDKLLWSRDPDTTDPLPPCSSSSFSPPPSLCDVCRLEKDVYMICDNLPDGETLNLEDPPESFYPKKSDCPRLPPAGHPTHGAIATPYYDRGRFFLHAALVCFVLLIIIIFLAYKLYKSQQTPGDGRCSVPQSEFLMY